MHPRARKTLLLFSYHLCPLLKSPGPVLPAPENRARETCSSIQSSIGAGRLFHTRTRFTGNTSTGIGVAGERWKTSFAFIKATWYFSKIDRLKCVGNRSE
ncbi:hypothetical protein ES703_57448 [subsurface metagenome]